jgi:pyruvate dehydrogenase E1 component alpha subunit
MSDQSQNQSTKPAAIELELLRQMLLMRRFEERAAQAYGLRKIGGFCHLYIGQEAVAAGAITTLDLQRDFVVTAYRDHAHALGCGMSPQEIMAELFGKATGCSRGKGGSMHLFSAQKHLLGGNGIVGSQIPVATGVALKCKNSHDGGVVLCFFGDGAIHQGAFHESLNLARIWNLPIVYICENNQYGMGTDYRRVSAVQNFSLMGQSYGIIGKQVDGMNVLAVYDAVSEAVERARNHADPTLLEISTYRYRGHSMSDPGSYRTKDELSRYKELDPITLLKELLVKKELLTEDAFGELDEQIKAQCEDAVQFAEHSPEPALHTLYEDVLA